MNFEPIKVKIKAQVKVQQILTRRAWVNLLKVRYPRTNAPESLKFINAAVPVRALCLITGPWIPRKS